MRIAAADTGEPQLLHRDQRRFVLARRVLPVERLDYAERRPMARQQIVKLRAKARVAKRMRRHRDSALAVNDFDERFGLEPPRTQIEKANHFARHPEEQEMAEIGISLDTLEQHHAEALRELGIALVEFRIGGEQARRGEAGWVGGAGS